MTAVGFGRSQTELNWDGKFNGMQGRGSVRFKEGYGLNEMVVVAYAFSDQKSVFASWQKKLAELHGNPAEKVDNSIAISRVWKLKSGFVIELKSIKDENSPVVSLHFVRE